MQAIRNELAWRAFAEGVWQDEINVRDFIVTNVTPYAGGPEFLARPSARTLAVWDELQPYFRDEIKKGVLDVDPSTPASLTAFGPGYIDRDNEVIVGLQTDKPFKRAIMPTGGFRMVEAGLKAAGVEVDPTVRDIFTKYRKTHNDGIFDLYTPEILECRRSGIITGLPDAYGRGRIIGDYRRVALYGVDRLIEAKQAERAELDARWPTEEMHADARGDGGPAPRPRGPQDDGRILRLRHRRVRRRTPARPCSGPTSATLARSRR